MTQVRLEGLWHISPRRRIYRKMSQCQHNFYGNDLSDQGHTCSVHAWLTGAMQEKRLRNLP